MAPSNFFRFLYVTQFPGKLHKYFCSIDCVVYPALKEQVKHFFKFLKQKAKNLLTWNKILHLPLAPQLFKNFLNQKEHLTGFTIDSIVVHTYANETFVQFTVLIYLAKNYARTSKKTNRLSQQVGNTKDYQRLFQACWNTLWPVLSIKQRWKMRQVL